jgi:hypothetical protein
MAGNANFFGVGVGFKNFDAILEVRVFRNKIMFDVSVGEAVGGLGKHVELRENLIIIQSF